MSATYILTQPDGTTERRPMPYRMTAQETQLFDELRKTGTPYNTAVEIARAALVGSRV